LPFSLKFKSKFFECAQEGEALKINLKNDWNYKLPAQIWTQTAALIGSKKFNKIILNFKGVRTLKEQETNNAQPFFFFTINKRDFKKKRGQEDNKVFLTFFHIKEDFLRQKYVSLHLSSITL